MIRATATTTSKGHIAKKDQITLGDDPDFNAELDIIADFDSLGLDLDIFPVLQDSNLQSLGTQSSQRSTEEEFGISSQQLHVPSDDFSAGAELLRSRSATRGSSLSLDRQGAHLGSDLHGEDIQRALEDVGFTFDADGELRESQIADHPPAEITGRPSSAALADRTGGSRLPSIQRQSMVTASRLNAERHELMVSQAPHDELDHRMLDDDFDLHPDAEPFDARPPDLVEDRPGHEPEESSSEDLEAAAPSRAHRQRRALPLDSQMELRNKDFTNFEQNYVQTMLQNATTRFNARNPHAAKLNAQVWLADHGLHGLGAILDPAALPPALQMFAGPNLLASFTAQHPQPSPSSAKRSRSHSPTSADRRVRPRLSSHDAEQGRAGPSLARDEDLPVLQDDPPDPSLEIGREANTPLPDRRSSQMPWNVSASQHGSSVQRRFPHLSVGGAGGPGSSSVAGGPLSVGLRGSSVAPSPLGGYGAHGSLSLTRRGHGHGIGEGREEEGGEETFQLPLDEGEMEVDHPALMTTELQGESQVDSQGVRRSSLPWAVKTLETEEMNFVAFVGDRIEEKQAAGVGEGGTENGGEDGGEEEEGVTFEQVVQPEVFDKVVACQALMLVLALNGKGVLKVEQGMEEAFMPIWLEVVG